MLRKLYYLSFLILIFGIIRCTSKVKTLAHNKVAHNKEKITPIETNLKRVWMLTQFKDFSKEYLTEKKAYLDLTVPEKAFSKMGCNEINFNCKIKSNFGIHFSKIMTTQMACTDMQLEEVFSEEISNYTQYKLEGYQLTLYASKNQKMTFVSQDWD